MIDKIVKTFESNHNRLTNLLGMYNSLGGGKTGRSNTSQLELLRATVVFTHSTLEDFLRSIEAWKIPLTESDVLKDIWLNETYRETKFNFRNLYKFRNLKIKTLMEKSVIHTLSYKSYNQPEDIIRTIENCQLVLSEDIKKLFPSLKLLMNRRHHIVHQADKNLRTGSGQHRYLSLSSKQVNTWIDNTDSLAQLIIGQL